ncbi:MAG: LytR/AlgR family response regulator transcription factor [Sarcina sp.]
MINIVICDDNIEQRNIVKKYISDIITDEEYKILEFESGEELVNKFPQDISIILLDIQMKTLTGMDVARWIREFNNKVEIIFITGLIDYIQEGYEVRAYRYLLKPVSFEDMNKHLKACINGIKKESDDYLIVSKKGEMQRVAINQILYVEIYRKAVTIYTQNDVYDIKLSLERLETVLKEHKFFRCHKSYLVNMKKIFSITTKTVVMVNKEVPLSKHRAKELKVELTNVLGDIIC